MTMLEKLEAVRDRLTAEGLPYASDLDEGLGEILVRMPMDGHKFKAIKDKKTGPVLQAALKAAREGNFDIRGGRSTKDGMVLMVE